MFLRYSSNVVAPIHIEKDAALERRFQPIQVDEPTVEDTIAILKGLRDRRTDTL
jgi:ATP-dependent Clp protease ATP-binding subunit ClpA